MAQHFIIQKKHPYSFEITVLDLFLCFITSQDYRDFYVNDREGIYRDIKGWAEFRYHLFWHAITIERIEEGDHDKRIKYWWQVHHHIRGLWVPNIEDVDRLFEDLSHKPLMDDRLVALSAIFDVYKTEGRGIRLRSRMIRSVAGFAELETALHQYFHPKVSEQEKIWRRREYDFKKRQEARVKQQESRRKEWQEALKRKPNEIKNVGDARKGSIWQRTAYLYDRMRENKRSTDNRLGRANWQELTDEFGSEVAKNFRDGCVAYWRDYDPFNHQDRRTSHSIPWPRIIGLTGLAMEAADDPEWAKYISRGEAELAAHYAVCELNGFTTWVADLRKEFDDIVDAVIKDELRWELYYETEEKTFTHTLSALRYGKEEFRKYYKDILFELLLEKEPVNDQALDYAISVILEEPPNAIFQKKIADLAFMRFKEALDQNRKSTWLVVLLNVDGERGTEMLKAWIASIPSMQEQKEAMVLLCAALTDHHGYARFGSSVHDYERIEVLSDLLPFIHQFVKVEEDMHHDGVYHPGARDDAEQTRSRLLNVIFNTPGRSSYDALINLSNTISNNYLKDRVIHLAKERAAIDTEFNPWSGGDAAEFAISAERQPETERDLYEIALARLDELKADIEEGDESDAAILKDVTKEPLIRLTFANRLKKSSRSFYTVGSEEELADAKKTDIRLHAPQVFGSVPIELKIADNWPLSKLRERLENQLIKQYMRTSRYGIFLLAHNGRKKHWKDPVTNRRYIFAELIEALRREETALLTKYPDISAVETVGIDFTVR